jgi:hypothetical protein
VGGRVKEATMKKKLIDKKKGSLEDLKIELDCRGHKQLHYADFMVDISERYRRVRITLNNGTILDGPSFIDLDMANRKAIINNIRDVRIVRGWKP